MSTDVSVFAADEVNIRYKEPTLTANLNRKLFANQPPGIYRGFKISTNLLAATVTITADPDLGDHVAVYDMQSGFALTIRRVGSFTVNLAAYAGQDVALALFGFYAVGPATTGILRVYTLAELALSPPELPDLLMLGQVSVVAGVIPAANITPNTRSSAWDKTAPEVTLWQPLIRNGSFELSAAASSDRFAARFWELSPASPFPNFNMVSSAPIRSGSRAATFTGVTLTADMYQWLEIPVTPGDMVRWRVYVSISQARLSGTLGFFVEFADATGAVTSTSSFKFTDGPDAGAFRKEEVTFYVPTGAAFIRRAGIKAAAYTLVAAGTMTIDDVQMWAERRGPLDKLHNDEIARGQASLSSIILDDPENPAYSGLAAALTFDYDEVPEGVVKLSRRDQQTGSGVTPPAINFPGRIFEGAGLTFSEDQYLQARRNFQYTRTAGHQYTLVEEGSPSSGGIRIRHYIGNQGEQVWTINAKWRAAGVDNWTKDTALNLASKIVIGLGVITAYSKNASGETEPWVDSLYVLPSTDGWSDSSDLTSAGATLRGSLSINDLNSQSNLPPAYRMHTQISTNTPRTLIHTTIDDSPGAGVSAWRLYMTRSGSNAVEFDWTLNAMWDDTTSMWIADNAALNASSTRVSFNRFRRLFVDTTITAAPWTDATFTSFSVGVDLNPNGLATLSVLFGGLDLGQQLNTTSLRALIPKLMLPSLPDAVGVRQLVFQQNADGANTKLTHRLYYSNTDPSGLSTANKGVLEWTTNAFWDDSPAQWAADDTGEDATIYRFGNILDISYKANTAAAWVDTAWDTSAGPGARGWLWDLVSRRLDFRDNRLKWTGISGASGANPNSNEAILNQLTPLGIIKAWGLLTVIGGVVALEDGLNISSVTPPQLAGDEILVTFAEPMGDTNYIVLCVNMDIDQVVDANGNKFQFGPRRNAGVKLTTSFHIRGVDTTSGAQLDLNGVDDAVVGFAVLGRQFS